MATESVQVALARLEGKVDRLDAKLEGRLDLTDNRLRSLESSRTKTITWIAGIAGSLVLAGIGAVAHVHP